jgi:hypothetical protein
MCRRRRLGLWEGYNPNEHRQGLNQPLGNARGRRRRQVEDGRNTEVSWSCSSLTLLEKQSGWLPVLSMPKSTDGVKSNNKEVMVGVAGFEPAANGSLQASTRVAPSTVHSSTRLLKARRNVALLSYTPLRHGVFNISLKGLLLGSVSSPFMNQLL